MSTIVEEIKTVFYEMFGEKGAVHSYFAPGRVNLIGEHTDYNGGHVFPCALTLGTYGIARKRDDRKIRMYSVNFKDTGVIESSLDELVPSVEAGWTNYVCGVIWSFLKHGIKIENGIDLLVYGDIPNGSGLSSSASLEVLVGLVLKDLFGYDSVDMQAIAVMGQYAENHYNNLNCGIMDQFASAMGKADHAIFLDTNTLTYEYAPLNFSNSRIVVTNSKVKHSLVSSAYNDRQRECKEALEDLQKLLPIKELGELSPGEYERYKENIKDPVCRKRAKHAVYENARTIQAVDALRKNDTEAFGKLMNESHISLRDDYEVSCHEIDTLVNLAWSVPGVYGSRITGGGFGGCTVSVVREENLDQFVKEVTEGYKNETGLQAEIYIVYAGNGAYKID